MARDMPRLRSRTVAVPRLTQSEIDAMWTIFAGYYDDVTPDRFQSDLAPKSHVILLLDQGNDSLQGFSTLEVYDRVIGGRRVVVVFSGDTVVTRPYWGQTVLQRAFLAFAMGRKLAHPLVPVYWFLISKGYKTYLLLSRNFPEHWPRHDCPTPAWQAEVLDTLAAEKFGPDWEPESGVLRHADPLGKLKDGIAPVEDSLLRFPDIRFFVERNPGYVSGDELCCLGRVGVDLWTSYMVKLIRKGLGFNSSKE